MTSWLGGVRPEGAFQLAMRGRLPGAQAQRCTHARLKLLMADSTALRPLDEVKHDLRKAWAPIEVDIDRATSAFANPSPIYEPLCWVDDVLYMWEFGLLQPTPQGTLVWAHGLDDETGIAAYCSLLLIKVRAA